MTKSSKAVIVPSKKMAAKKSNSKEALIQKGFAHVDKHRGAFGSVAKGARIACMAYHTFRDRYEKRYSGVTFYGPPPVLGRDTEQVLHDYVVSCAQVAMCLTVAIICEIAQQLADKLKVKTKIKYGRTWLKGFMQRQPGLAKRQPQLCESFRFTAVSSPNMENYFRVLGEAIKDVPPEKIWNMDESGISLRNTRSTVGGSISFLSRRFYAHNYPISQVIAQKGQRNVNVVYEGENKHVTFVACVSAAGASITPIMIFSGQRPLAKHMKGYPEAVLKMSESGFINNDIWYDWVQHFVAETGGNCVLIADWHSTRADLRALQYLREHNVKLVVLQPHTTHVCQPLDVSGFRSMKGNFRSIVAERRARRMRTDLSDIAGICKEAWKRTMQMKRGTDGKDSNPAMHGFEKTGIYPFDPSKISPDLKKIGDGLLERARLLREQEEAKEAKEDGLHVPKVTGKRERVL